MDLFELWIRPAAGALGLLVFSLPVVQVWRRRHIRRGRRLGAPTFMTRWPAVFVLAASCLYVGFLFWEPLPLSLSVGLRLFLTLLGTLIYLPGILLYGWGLKTLGSMFAVSSGIASELYEEHHLVDYGPFAIVRHPMYLGVLMAAVGALLLFRTWSMVIFAPLAFGVIFRARREEKLLEKELGEAWVEYRDRVPAWLPRFRKWSKDGSAP